MWMSGYFNAGFADDALMIKEIDNKKEVAKKQTELPCMDLIQVIRGINGTPLI